MTARFVRRIHAGVDGSAGAALGSLLGGEIRLAGFCFLAQGVFMAWGFLAMFAESRRGGS